MDSNYKFLVFTKCLTFNHHAYIEDAMNGFCIQETNFPFVCVIIDDASTDGEPEVIMKYFDAHFDLSESGETDDYTMTFGQHKTNKNCYFAVLYLKYNHYSIKKSKVPYYSRWQDNCKYIALCEGDDYWIAKDKLQRQTDFLEEHEDYSMVHTAFSFLNQDDGLNKFDTSISNKINNISKQTSNYIPYILNNNVYRVQTCSVLYRKDAYLRIESDLKEMTTGFLMGDTQLWCLLNICGNICFLQEPMCVYRIHQGSSCRPNKMRQRVRFELSCAEMRVLVGRKLGISEHMQEMFRKKMFRKLTEYRYYCPEYVSIVDIKLTRSEKIISRLCNSKIIRLLFIKLYYFVHICGKLKNVIVEN